MVGKIQQLLMAALIVVVGKIQWSKGMQFGQSPCQIAGHAYPCPQGKFGILDQGFSCTIGKLCEYQLATKSKGGNDIGR
jgi:hypothetical protein